MLPNEARQSAVAKWRASFHPDLMAWLDNAAKAFRKYGENAKADAAEALHEMATAMMEEGE